MTMTRREMLALAAGSGAAAVSCGRRAKPESAQLALVSITRAPSYGPELYGSMRRILNEHKINVKGKRVVLKPNLVEFDSSTCINTHPVVVHAALEAFRALGAADVRIAEGPGHRRITLDLADAAGYFSIIPKFESTFTDLNLDDVSEVSIPQPASKLRSVYLPKTVLGCDLLVSLPKMKTHHWVGATLSMKNFFGLVPGAVYGWPKNVLHWAGIPECIADLQKIVPRTFAIVDGIVAMEGNGPIQGSPKQVGVLVAGAGLGAVDSTCCRIMSLNPDRVRYLEIAAAPNLARIHQIGERIETVRQSFSVLPQFQYLHSS
jgi:uncharacterized protein (DUF362 family)